MSQYIIQGIFVVAGIIALLAAILDWDWFFTAQNTQFVVRNVGRRQARWFYGILGMLLIGMSVFFFPEYTANMTAEINRKLVVTRHFFIAIPLYKGDAGSDDKGEKK